MRKFTHRLALLRFILGKKTQAQFGATVGVSGNYIKKIELGQRRISDPLALSIQHMFGLDRESLSHPLPEPGTEAWHSLVVVMWLATNSWQDTRRSANEETPQDFLTRFVPVLQRVVDAAAKKKRAVALLLSLKQWIMQAQVEFGLPPSVIAEFYYAGAFHDKLRFNGKVTLLSAAPEYLKKEMGPAFPELAAAHDNRFADTLPDREDERGAAKPTTDRKLGAAPAKRAGSPKTSSRQPAARRRGSGDS